MHLVAQSHPGEELVRDCGTWFQPPEAGSCTVWVEQESTISLSQSVIIYGAEPFMGKGFMSAHPNASRRIVDAAVTRATAGSGDGPVPLTGNPPPTV